MQEPFITTV
jgi:hypothetical protein